MKKFSVLYIFCFVFSALAYTSEDTSNANYLGDQGIITKQTIASQYRLDDKILRQEVIGMALKVKGITLPENYTCKKYFADATKNDWVCRAVELAADNGIISRSNKYANPGKDITRAEGLAMIMKAAGLSTTTDGYQNDGITEWQKNIISQAKNLGLWDSGYTTLYDGPIRTLSFYPNKPILRYEVFQITYNSLKLSQVKKSALSVDFKILDKKVATDISIIGDTRRPCIDPQDEFLIGYGPDKVDICGTVEYKKGDIIFQKSLKDFIAGKYRENFQTVCDLIGGRSVDGFGCHDLIRIEENNIFFMHPDFGGGGITMYQIIVHDNLLFLRSTGRVSYNSDKEPVIDPVSGWDTNELDFYKQIVNSGVVQK